MLDPTNLNIFKKVFLIISFARSLNASVISGQLDFFDRLIELTLFRFLIISLISPNIFSIGAHCGMQGCSKRLYYSFFQFMLCNT